MFLLQTSPPDVEWFPRLRCMSLNTEEAENTEQNEMKELRDQLNDTNQVVKQLSSQLSELRDRVSLEYISLTGNYWKYWIMVLTGKTCVYVGKHDCLCCTLYKTGCTMSTDIISVLANTQWSEHFFCVACIAIRSYRHTFRIC